MASTHRGAARKSYLSLQPVHYSLTAGTNIPAPLDSPPESPASSVRPPTPGGGPLTSHPTTPEAMPGAFPPTPDAEKGSSADGSTTNSNAWQPRVDSFRTNYSPSSATQPQNTPPPAVEPQRRPSGVRKLLSLSSLRSSFNNSRTSLHNPRTSNDAPNYTTGIKRPSSPSIASTTASSYQQRPELRSKKSGSSWFKRKSGMFNLNVDGLDAVDENQRPDTRDSKRMRESSPAPLLPDIGAFGGGEIGWDEQRFTR
ncbi:hypothetical protein LTR36_000669 [Oleoguttula mirabilis]|uniref:Uncharacterized protein n=1 Tax=Oleoguttula mirabilis TaxID=1507867 RepID=A0AAV9JQ51_9PEZI|nr:hypothetical protein LTR36_000669 [Oleoguttula mirabilis]